MLQVRKKWIGVFLVGALLSSFLAVMVTVPVAAGDSPEIEDLETPDKNLKDGSQVLADNQGLEGKSAIPWEELMTKIDPNLRAAISSNPSEMVSVIVPTTDVSSLARVVQKYEYKGLLGTKAKPSQNIVPITLEVPAASLMEIASLDSVMAIYQHEIPTVDMVPKSDWAKYELPEEEASSWDLKTAKGFFDEEIGEVVTPIVQGEEVPPETHDFAGGLLFNEAPKAWADGYTGAGVMVALHDSGVDFAHPDLQGTQARFDVSLVDPAVLAQKPYLADYDGWPIAFDPLSMEDFLGSGGDLSDPGLVGYVDTSTVSPMISLPVGDYTDFTRNSPVPSFLEYIDQQIFDDSLAFPFPDIFVLQDTYQLDISVPAGTVLMMISVGWPTPADDLDAALFYDSNGDHIPTLDELISYEESSTGANPERLADVRLPNTANDYMLRVLGYHTSNPTLAVINITFVSLVEVTVSYNVTGIQSMSDQYHLGLLNDAWLTSTYFVPPAVLLVDSTIPGFYDTYYADLDFDLEFNDEKPALKGDEISFVDVNGDGYADISGGMVYYISNAASVTDEAVITASGGETYAILANGNISVPERITVKLGGTEWRTTVVTSEALPGQVDDTTVTLQNGNIVEGSVVLTGTDVVVDNETSFTSQTGNEAGFSLAHSGVDTATVQIYRFRVSEDWYAERWVMLTKGTDYTVAGDGSVTLSAELVSGADPFKKNLPDDEFHAFYSYSEIMTEDEDYTIGYETGEIALTYPWGSTTAIAADYEYYNWVLDYVEGNLTFTNPLSAGDVITADYQYGVTPIPYSDVYSERRGIDNYYPGSGDMVALMVGHSGNHGTMTAGQIVSAGNVLYGRTRGVAPDAKIIPVLTGAGTAILDVFDGWYFEVEGYDGVPNSGDDAQISSNSWGGSGVSGFHFYDRFSDWLSTNYSQGGTIFTVSSGNSGPGYGSLGPPNAPSLMMVSGAQHFFYRVMPEFLTLSYDGGPNPGGMETWYGGSVGPTVSGSFGVDVMAEASFVLTPKPLNDHAVSPSVGPGGFNGFYAIDFVSGTSFAAPTAAGILALAYDAYKQKNGVFPDANTVKAIVMSGATDIDNDPFVQGAGYVNAWNAARIAGGTGGAYATPYNWIPGDWRGTEYEAFPKLLEAGESDTEMFTLTNPSAAALTYDISTDILEKVGEAQYSYNPSDMIQPITPTYGLGSLFYILNGTGIYDMYDHSLVQAVDPNLWNNADLLRITSAMPSSDDYGDQYLEIHRFTDGIVNDQWRGHSGAVQAVDVSPDGTMMASIGQDGRLFITDTVTSQIIWVFTYGAGPVISGSFNTFDVKFTANSTWVLATFGNNTISVWDVSTGTFLFDLTNGALPDLSIFSLDVSPNGTWVVGGTDIDPVTTIAYVYVWDLTNPPNPIGMYMGMTVGPVNDVGFSPNGTWVAASDYSWWTVNVFNVTTLMPIVEFDTDPTISLGYPMSVEFSPDGTKIAYTWKYGWYLRHLGLPEGLPGAGFPDVGIYDITILDYVGWMAGHDDVVMDLSWSPDGTKLATCSGLRPDLGGDDNTVKIWDATQDDTLLETVVNYFDFVNQVDFAPDNIHFASASADGTALIVDTTDTPVLEYTVTTALVDTFSRGLWFERNRLVTSFYYNVELVRLHDPATRNPDGVIIWGRSIGFSAPDTTRRITIEYYQKAPWTWLGVAPSVVNVPAGGTVTFDATMTVPGTAGVGLYEGYIRASEPTYGDITIPVMVNVPATSAVFSFGGDTSSFNLYDNNKLHQNLDTRYYFMDVPDTFVFSEGMKLMVDVDSSQPLTGLDARHFDQGVPSVPGTFPGDAPEFPESRYGPYVLEETDVGAPGVFAKTPDWTDAGLGMIKGLSAEAGLNMIAIDMADDVAADLKFYEDISGETGIMRFSPYPLEFSTSQLQGSKPLTMTTNVPWLPNPDPFEESYGKSVATTVAGSETFEFLDIPIAYDGEPAGDESFIEYLSRSQNTMLWDVDPSVITIEFHMMGHAFCCPDMDLGIFLDANGDDQAQPDEFVRYDADADADETVSLLLPTPGRYIIAMAGFDVLTAGSLADLTITELAVGPSPFTMTGIANTIPRDSTEVMDLEWDLPLGTAEGPIKAAFFISPGNAPLSFVLLVPVTLNFDTTPPEILQTTPVEGSVTAENMAPILAGFSDDQGEMDWTTIRLWLDGVDITAMSSVFVPFDEDSGYITGTVAYVPTAPVADGMHTLKTQVGDFAGNIEELTWHFYIDTAAPLLEINHPSTDVTIPTDSIIITGTTEPDAAVTIRGEDVQVDSDGSFSYTFDQLTEGVNTLAVTAEDPVGNAAVMTRLITVDTEPPELEYLITSEPLASPTNAESLTISGKFSEKVELTINDKMVPVNGDGTFETTISLEEGVNTIVLDANDAAGHTFYKDDSVITKDTIAPTLTITIPASNVDPITGEALMPWINITGTVSTDVRMVTVNGLPTVPSNGAFTKMVALSFGANEITVIAEDEAGNVAVQSISVTWSPDAEVVKKTYTTLILIVLAVVLLIIGLLIGLMLGRRPEVPEEELPEEEIPEEVVEEVPEEEPEELPLEEEPLEEVEMPEEIPPEETRPSEEGEL